MKGKPLFFIIILLIGLVTYTAFFGLSLGSFSIEPVRDSINLGLDIEGGVVVVFEAQTDATGEELTAIMNQAKSVISRRVDSMGLTEPNIVIEGTDRIRIEMPGVKDPQEALDIIGQTAKLEFRLVAEGDIALTGMKSDEFESELILTGESVKDAGITSDDKGRPAVGLEFDSEGTQAFADATGAASKYASGSGQIAIILDGEVISAPFVDKTIAGGTAIIQGNFTYEEAGLLASLIRGGALPADLVEVQSSVIGPTLGLEAMETSIFAAAIGFLLIMTFMIVYYRLPGVIASLTLLLYSTLLLLIMVFLGATLTLPGIAGIVLSIGMAIDANVIIFERIKEELRNEKSLRASIESGFSRAMRTILDANVTTFIAAIVLYSFGEGPIQGFAITLMIGIIVSMFTAVVVTKTLLKTTLEFKVFNNKKLFGL